MKIQFRSRLPSHNLYTSVKFCTHRSNVNLYKIKTRIAFFCLQDITQKYVFLRERKLIAHFSAKFCVPSFCIIWSKLDLIVAGPPGFPGVRRWSRHPDRANWESHCGCKLYGGQGLILCLMLKVWNQKVCFDVTSLDLKVWTKIVCNVKSRKKKMTGG